MEIDPIVAETRKNREKILEICHWDFNEIYKFCDESKKKISAIIEKQQKAEVITKIK